MEKDKKEPQRNRPSEEGRDNDPHLRDEDARQGANTMSSSGTDESNEHLTKTAGDNFRTDNEFGKNADPTFEDADKGD